MSLSLDASTLLSHLTATAQQHQDAVPPSAAAVPVGVPAPPIAPAGQVRQKRPYKKRKKTQEEYDALPPLQRSLRPRPPLNYVPMASDTKLYKPKKSSSEVWNTFRLHRDYPGWTLCLKCNNWLHYSGSTSTLRYHANDSCARANVTVSPQLLGPVSAGGARGGGNTSFIIHTKTSSGTVSSTFGRTRLDKETLRQEGEFRLLEMLSDAHFTQSQLSSPSFAAFCQVLNPTFTVPDRSRVDQLTEHYYNAVCTQALMFVQNAEVLAVSADITATSGGSPVHSLTVHTMQPDWTSKRFVLAAYPLKGDSTTFVLKDVVREFVNRCRQTNRLLSAVTEEAAKLLQADLPVDPSIVVSKDLRGSCRLLHNVVSEALNLGAITPLLNRFRNVVNAVVQNPLLARRIYAIQPEDQPKKPLLQERPVPNASDPEYDGRPLQFLEDASSRWLSTLQMLERLNTLHIPVLNAVAESKMEIKLPDEPDWVELSQLVTLLEPLSQAVIVLQNDLHSAAWPTMTVLHWVLTGKRANAPDMPDWSTVSPAVNAVREHILRSIPSPDVPVRASHPSVLATLLDPRYKDLGFARDQNLENKAHQLFLRVAKLEEDMPSMASMAAPPLGMAISPLPAGAPPTNNGKPDEKDPQKTYLMRLMQPPAMGKSALEREIDQYRAWQIDTHAPFDCLSWWKTNAVQLPILARLARKYLALPSTTSFAEPLVKKVLPQFRVAVPQDRMHPMVFIQQNRENVAPSARVAQAAYLQGGYPGATPIAPAPPPPPKSVVNVDSELRMTELDETAGHEDNSS